MVHDRERSRFPEAGVKKGVAAAASTTRDRLPRHRDGRAVHFVSVYAKNEGQDPKFSEFPLLIWQKNPKPELGLIIVAVNLLKLILPASCHDRRNQN